MSLLAGLATSVLVDVIEGVLRRKDVPVANSQAPTIALEVAKELQPVIDNAANKEPWYQSRIFWVQIISIIAGLVGLIWGYEISPEDRDLFITLAMLVGTAIGPALTLYARFKTGLKPLGE